MLRRSPGARTTSPPRTDQLRGTDAGPRGDDRRLVPFAAPGRARRLRRLGEWRGKAGGYAVQGSRGRFVDRAARLAHERHRLPLAELLADLQALEALPALPAAGFGARRHVTRARADRDEPRRASATASPRRARRGPPRRSRSPARGQQEDAADDVRAALAAGQRAFGENYARSCATRRRCSRADAPAARVALHRAAAEQQGEIRRRQVALCIRSIRGAARRDRARGARQACLCR
jgi:hypothetical protein